MILALPTDFCTWSDWRISPLKVRLMRKGSEFYQLERIGGIMLKLAVVAGIVLWEWPRRGDQVGFRRWDDARVDH